MFMNITWYSEALEPGYLIQIPVPLGLELRQVTVLLNHSVMLMCKKGFILIG